ncbi:hypothetical protein [Devosia sp. 63-57]|uniref:hypothetical protein n=1 Tax=Devosia sp. 63-57 TaxID=1895751 RepID=UPI00086D92DB|nr:hypothetical protein [Devosia sp. 63-57]ODT47512.1 MAG: hypothetical protein ABS74_14705 [Pelagibacterium sp. SCN 63-126]ODU86141.1 MAG: hypothetical protein ABT14_10140 [Pelagibacterium sp. SCN 63-17]OJX42782.1 MAG: hypothetical protein BGO80_15160 [Devosia sp. 63-57]
MLLRILLFTALIVLIYLGIRRIWKDWTGKFKTDEEQARIARRERDAAERQRPDVIDLKRDDDGTYRPHDQRDTDKRH